MLFVLFWINLNPMRVLDNIIDPLWEGMPQYIVIKLLLLITFTMMQREEILNILFIHQPYTIILIDTCFHGMEKEI